MTPLSVPVKKWQKRGWDITERTHLKAIIIPLQMRWGHKRDEDITEGSHKRVNCNYFTVCYRVHARFSLTLFTTKADNNISLNLFSHFLWSYRNTERIFEIFIMRRARRLLLYKTVLCVEATTDRDILRSVIDIVIQQL